MSAAPQKDYADASSESNVPLIQHQPKPKDYEAAAAALMLKYGAGGSAITVPVRPHKTKEGKKKKEYVSKGNHCSCSTLEFDIWFKV